MRICIALAVFAAPALADCPPSPDRSDDLAALFSLAQTAETEAAGRAISGQMWTIWADAPDARAQELLDEGMARREVFDFDAAQAAFDALVTYCPDYAEGYNQRAFVAFLRQDYPAALVDLDLALARSPNHVAALAGKALTLMGLGRDVEAQELLRRAVTLNPWIPERGLLRDAEDDTF